MIAISTVNDPFISIIIPVYNAENYILDCLNSITRQTYKFFELIIIDDCSTDNSFDLINKFILENPELCVKIAKTSKNSGQSTARNIGISMAKGKYCYFIDSDDDILSTCLQILAEKAVTTHADIIVAENYLISDNSKEIIQLGISGTIYDEDVLKSYCKRQWYNTVWNKLFKRELIIKHNLKFVEDTIIEDELWSFEIACLAKKVVFISEPTYNYYIRPKSTITNIRDSYRRWLIFFEINKRIRKCIDSNNLTTNIDVGFYLFENLLIIIGKLHNHNILTPNLLNDIIHLNFISPFKLFRAQKITIKQFIAYSYFYLNLPFSYHWYKFLSHISK